MSSKLKSYLLLICLLIAALSISACLYDNQGVTKIVDNGDPSTHIDLTFIGSGFTSNEMQTYEAKVAENLSRILTVNWFVNNYAKFNVWMIDANSPVSGQDLDQAKINSLAAQTPCDILIVLHNYDGQESYGQSSVHLYKYSSSYVVLAHELGHVIGKLDDEYHTPATAWKCDGLSKRTLNIHDQPSNEKWSDLIDTPPYEGARYCEAGLFRPSENSIMRDSAHSTYFDAVGYKAMDLGAGKILGTIESDPPSLDIFGVESGDTKSGNLNIEAITHDESGIERVEFYWSKEGETSKSIKIARTPSYSLFIDTTRYENGRYYLDTYSYDKNWNYTRLTTAFTIANNPDDPGNPGDPGGHEDPGDPPVAGLHVPITVHEALTQDSDYCARTGKIRTMPGMDRINEPLTVGIPLAEDSGITDIAQLGLRGANIQQFRPLAYWPNGNLKWVLVDTQISVPKDYLAVINLVEGTGNSGGSALAADNGDYIIIDTGPAQFRLKKRNFNLFDEVVVNGKRLVLPNNSGGLSMVGYENRTYTLLDGTTHTLKMNETYDSKNDADSGAVIEENGPVRAVVKAMGSFKDTLGNRLMDYTIRFHFYKNKSYVKTYVIMRHGKEEKHINESGKYSQMPRIFSQMQLSIPLNLGDRPKFEFATRDSIVSGTIDNTASLFQAFSEAHRRSTVENDKLDATTSWPHPPMERAAGDVGTNYIQRGLELKNGSATLNPLGDSSHWTRGFAEIKDQSNIGLSIAMKYMSSYWPSSITFTSQGNVEVGVFSRYNSKKDIVMGWGTHETREILFDFHTDPIDNLTALYRIEQPLVGRASINYYGKTKALFGQEGLVSATAMDDWFLRNFGQPRYGIPKDEWSHCNNGVLVWRTFWYSGVQGTDVPACSLFTFLKNGAGGRYMGGLQKTLFNTDSAIRRTDDFDYSKSIIKSDYRYAIVETDAYNAGGGQNHFDYYSHNHWWAMPLYYYLTGNEEIKEAIHDYLEEFIKKGPIRLKDGDTRSNSRYYSTIALGFEFSQDERLKSILESMTDMLLDSRDENSKPGRNPERGYVWEWPNEENPHLRFFFISIHPDAVWQGLRVLKTCDTTYPRSEELEDYLLGVSQCIYHELYFDEPGGTDFGYLNRYLIHSANQWVDGEMGKFDSSRAMWFAYLKTGDVKYLERGKKLLAFGGGLNAATPYPAQDLMYADLYGLNTWHYLDNLEVVNNGNNNYALTWTVPDGAVSYQIKFSDKPIVDWLGFNQATREFQYDPASFTAFFAAANIDNEPQPDQPGSKQSCTIDIPGVISSYNTSRNLEPNNPSFITYDPDKTYYFAMKYFAQ
ncbi:MAG: M64 family metallopeptidase [bacterium]